MDALINIEEVNFIPDTYNPVPASDLSSFGLAGDSLRQFVQSISRPGGEGIYKVTFPKGFENMTLSKFNSENAYMGSGMVDGSFKQARLTQIQFDPTQMFMAFVLINISGKLKSIQEKQREILNFMYDVEEAKLAGNLNTLNEYIEDYKHNCSNDPFIKQLLAQVGNIKREASQSLKLYLKQIHSILDTPNSLHTIGSANELVNKIRRNIRNYHLAFYIHTYCAYLETFLIGNYNDSNLEHVRDRFISDGEEYESLMSQCRKWAKQYLESAIGKEVAPVLKGIDDVYAKIPLPFETGRFFKADAERYVSKETQMNRLEEDKDSGISIFADSIDQIKALQSNTIEIYINEESVYILEETEKVEGAVEE